MGFFFLIIKWNYWKYDCIELFYKLVYILIFFIYYYDII